MLHEEFKKHVGQEESETLIYKAVLPPSKSIAKMIGALSNTKGGYIILGVNNNSEKIVINGLNEDFRAKAIVFKALGLLSPIPIIQLDYFHLEDKKLFGIKVEKNPLSILFGTRKFVMKGGSVTTLKIQNEASSNVNIPVGLKTLRIKLNSFLVSSTEAKQKVIKHYQDAIEIILDSKNLLYPDGTDKISISEKGRLLQRILFSSVADNFETYLSDLLYEIYLAKPQTLINEQKVTIREVLNCSDMQEFVEYWAKRKISSLHKGSVKGFIEENKQIKHLGVVNSNIQKRIEAILQIRHLYTHRNGIIDEKFLKYFTTLTVNQEYKITIDEFCQNMEYLSEIINDVDNAAIAKYNLSII